MKTIEKTCTEFCKKLNSVYDEKQVFKAGVEFAQRWIPISEEKPKYYDSALVKFENGEILLVWRAYSELIESDIYTIFGTNIIADSKPIEWKPINLE